MLDVHTREPITVITQRYLGGVRFFCRWSQSGHYQKSALFISEIRVERSHDVLYKLSQNLHNYWVLQLGGNTSIQEKTKEFSMLHRHLIFSFVHWYNRQVRTGFLPSSAAASIHYRYTLCAMNAAVHICIALHTMYDDISRTVIMLRQFDQ